MTLLRRSVAVELDPATVFEALYAHAENAFWLDSGTHATSGMSYLGASATVCRWHSWAEILAGTVGFGAMHRPPEAAPAEGADADGAAAADTTGAGPRFRLGWVGWLEYELGTLDEERAGRTPRPRHPVAVFLRVDRAVEFDHATGGVTLLALDEPGAEEWFAQTTAALQAASAGATSAKAASARAVNASATNSSTTTPAEEPASAFPTPAQSDPSTRVEASVRHPAHDYERLVEQCKRIIERGDAYQLCLTNRFAVNEHVDPFETYRRLREASPSHHSGYLRVGDTALLSSSPEQFLSVDPHGTVVTRPIKGTRPRGDGPVEDALLVRELAASQKERAENLMIVDLMRNDLARVCRVGSVQVTSLLEVETYRQVHQLVSTVEGQLADGVTGLDAVAVCFPAGSMTGAPKRSAMAHLAALEGGPRGIYSGAYGYLSFDGSVDLAMVIRSIVLTPDGASIGAGGGITALSEAADELRETRVKAAALLAVLGARAPVDDGGSGLRRP
ncbi:anthranilate synthase component I family protein [Herbiconiux daphne]|uniref:Anthranilate synthase component I family protein n=1 Tax=Herbiconiux daphne TaxID=2970914 RepID=A0ABT2GYU3_9MICO|nr:anthranilate synthase component I family protein [Herbiconiux daphne]MCS5733127.1 anthranilate synthase component I family protein [Herbiconiux daphne]